MFGYNDSDVGATFDREGFFATGDLGCLTSTGCLKRLGRLKDTIEVRGTAVAPAEIESRLLTFPGVEDALVFGVRSDANDERRAAIIHVSSDAHLDAGDFRPHLMRCLSGYKVPTAVAVVGSGSVPRSGTGEPACIKAMGSFHALRPDLGRVSTLSRETWDCQDA